LIDLRIDRTDLFFQVHAAVISSKETRFYRLRAGSIRAGSL
jgi:hypothetical protein